MKTRRIKYDFKVMRVPRMFFLLHLFDIDLENRHFEGISMEIPEGAGEEYAAFILKRIEIANRCGREFVKDHIKIAMRKGDLYFCPYCRTIKEKREFYQNNFVLKLECSICYRQRLREFNASEFGKERKRLSAKRMDARRGIVRGKKGRKKKALS